MEKFKKVEDIKRPLLKGELFLVPCIVRESSYEDKTYITPVFNSPHSDKENGQHGIHYHADFRFLKHNNNGNNPTVINNHSKHFFCEHIRPVEELNGALTYFILPVINEGFTAITPVNLIQNSKLKHKCIHKGKCSHKGYDLSQVKPIDGKITCPLHGLQYCAKTKELLNTH